MEAAGIEPRSDSRRAELGARVRSPRMPHGTGKLLDTLVEVAEELRLRVGVRGDLALARGSDARVPKRD